MLWWDVVSIFCFKDNLHVPTELNNAISSFPYITQYFIEPHCENMWVENSGSGMTCHLTADYGAAED